MTVDSLRANVQHMHKGSKALRDFVMKASQEEIYRLWREKARISKNEGEVLRDCKTGEVVTTIHHTETAPMTNLVRAALEEWTAVTA